MFLLYIFICMFLFLNNRVIILVRNILLSYIQYRILELFHLDYIVIKHHCNKMWL